MSRVREKDGNISTVSPYGGIRIHDRQVHSAAAEMIFTKNESASEVIQ